MSDMVKFVHYFSVRGREMSERMLVGYFLAGRPGFYTNKFGRSRALSIGF